VRGQLLYEPNDGSLDPADRRLYDARRILLRRGLSRPGDQPLIGNLNDRHPIWSAASTPRQQHHQRAARPRPVARRLQQSLQPNIYISPGRTLRGETEDWRHLARVEWDLGGATLTSITAYRDYESGQPGDVDYGTVDILYRADRASCASSRRSARNCASRVGL
jgi:hypothetical protein